MYHIVLHTILFPRAGGADFDTAPIRIVMEPSEFSQQDYPFTVKVVADKINEATQNFVLVLRLESAIRRESVNTAVRNSTRCIINDDDCTLLVHVSKHLETKHALEWFPP